LEVEGKDARSNADGQIIINLSNLLENAHPENARANIAKAHRPGNQGEARDYATMASGCRR
jgi:hypothetical protein